MWMNWIKTPPAGGLFQKPGQIQSKSDKKMIIFYIYSIYLTHVSVLVSFPKSTSNGSAS